LRRRILSPRRGVCTKVAVILVHRKPFEAIVAILCVALSLVFAGAGASHIVDRAQHAAEIPGHHDHLAFSDVAYDDHRAGHSSAVNLDVQNADHDAGPAHHHHGDSHSGCLPATDDCHGGTRLAAVQLAAELESLASGTRPSGLERPPKRIDRPA
jgi:hypothetical protein